MTARQPAGPDGAPAAGRAPALILVQHAHQHLVAAGYDSREDVFDLHRALAALICEHLATRVPLALHVSGTLTTALTWHVPTFADLVRRALEEGVVELVGSAYAQNVMPLFSREHNLRQLNETLRLYRHHYGVEPEQVRCMWVPERVWNTEALAEVVSSPDLPNGGYTAVLLDDRHAYRTAGPDPAHAYRTEVSRAAFDAGSAPAAACAGRDPFAGRALPGGDGRHLGAYRVAGAERLVVLPMSSELRYVLPLQSQSQMAQLARLAACARDAGQDAVLIFGDDAERSAGIGLWAPRPWREESLAPYAATLRALAEADGLAPTLPGAWLAAHEVATVRPVDPAGFYELVTEAGAGEDYQGFWGHPEWAPYRAELQAVEDLLVTGEDAPAGGLWDAAWHQLMVASYETAWQEPDEHGRHRPAPWAKATANHVREARLLVAAAGRAHRREPGVAAQLCDVDGDGHEEVVLSNDSLFLVLSPRFGGRLVLACDLTSPGGRIVLGNLADDWNWQEQPHQFMGTPRNHPGALADIGAENDVHEVVDMRVDGGVAVVTLANVEPGSRLRGLRKTLRLAACAPGVEVSYRLPAGCGRVGVEFALSPDYLRLLREGRGALIALSDDSPRRRGFAAAQNAVWIDVDGGQPVLWDRALAPECGHAGVLRLSAWGDFDLTLSACDAAAVHAAYELRRIGDATRPDRDEETYAAVAG